MSAPRKLADLFLRPYFEFYGATPHCTGCASPLTAREFCAHCHFRACVRPACADLQKGMQKTFHTKALCEANAPRLFDRDVRALLKIAVAPDEKVDKTLIDALLVSLHLHAMQEHFIPPDTPEKCTELWMKWRNGAFPPASADDNRNYMENLPRLSSNYRTLMSVLFGAMFLRHDGSADAIVQLFLILYYTQMVQVHDIYDIDEAPHSDTVRRTVIPPRILSHRRMNVFTNPMDGVTKRRNPFIQTGSYPSTKDTLPSTFFSEFYKRPVTHSLLLFNFIALDLQEVECMLKKSDAKRRTVGRPAVFLTTSVLAHASKTASGEVLLRLVQSHQDCFSVGNWLNGALPKSDITGIEVAHSPTATRQMTDRFDIAFIGKAMDALVDRTTTSAQRRDAYRDLTGITVADAATVPFFTLCYFEANLTL
jgi:hypothetical protein